MAKRHVTEIRDQIAVTGYLDYREYLSALYEAAKAQVSPYSYLQFAADLGFSATNVLRLVIAGKRTLAPKSAQTIAKALDLRHNDRRYFLALVAFNNTKGAELRQRRFEELLAVKRETLASEDDKRAVSYFSDWTHPVLREMLRLPGFQSSPAAVRALLYPELRTAKAEEALAFLESSNFATRREDGSLSAQDDTPVTLPADAAAGHLSVLSFHEEMLDVAKECLSKVPAKRREFNALTLCVSYETLSLIKKRLRELCVEVLQLEANDPKQRECVAQLNLQLFALTKPRSPES
jgi:uncharacterized protein (TIGR02147 family)